MPKSEENGAITNSLLKYTKTRIFTRWRAHPPIIYEGQKGESIHKAVRSPTRYIQKKVTRDTYTKPGGQGGRRHSHQKREVNFRASLSTKGEGFSLLTFTNLVRLTGGEVFAHRLSAKGEGFSLLTFTHLLIPAALPPITSLGGIRGPITIPRGTTTRRRTLDRATGLSRTGTNTGCTLMHRRWRFGDLFG